MIYYDSGMWRIHEKTRKIKIHEKCLIKSIEI